MIDQIVVISPYPKEEKGVAGGASRFIYQLLPHLLAKQIIVLTQNKLKPRIEKNIITIDSWSQNSILPYSKVFSIVENTDARVVVINFEYSAFGGISGLIGLLITLLILRLKYNQKIIVIFHPALLSLRELIKTREHLGVSLIGLPLVLIYSIGMRFYAQLLVLISAKLIVFEENFKNRMFHKLFGAKDKVDVIPHQTYSNITERTEKKHTQLRLLFFGFIVPYKGLDVLLDAIEGDERVTLTVAGGRSPNAMNKSYFEKLVPRMLRMTNVNYKGPLLEKDIVKEFKESDLLILPYTSLIASSGPFAWALATETPFILSNLLSIFTESKDFSSTLKELHIEQHDFCFEPTVEGIKKIIDSLLNNDNLLYKLHLLSKELALKRQPEKIGEMYTHLIERAYS